MDRNKANQSIPFKLKLASDGVSAYTGAANTVTILVTGYSSGNTGTESSGLGTVTAIGSNGQYVYVPTLAETNYPCVLIEASATGCLPKEMRFYPSTPQTADVGVQNWGYIHGAVWIDSVNGTAGTTVRTNGIATNPVTTIASAKSIADSLKLKRFWIQAGSSLTLSADMAGYFFDGRGWGLNAASTRDVSGSTIIGCEVFTGLYAAAVREFYLIDSQIGDCTLGEADIHRSHIVGTITLNATVLFYLRDCTGCPFSPATPTLNFNSTADARAAVVSNFGGSLTVTNMRAGNILYLDGNCDLTLAASCTGGTVYLNGNIRLTNNGSGQTLYRADDPTGIATLLSRVTALRAGYWDNLSAGPVALYSQILDAAGVRTAIGLGSANLDTQLSGINSKTTNLPASPAAVGSAMTLTSAYDAAKDAASQTSVNAIPTGPLLAVNYTAPPAATTIADEVRLELATELDRIDAKISTRSTYAGTDTAGVTDLLTRLTVLRAGYLDNLSVGPVALSSQIPANFTAATFSDAGVFADTALVHAPTGATFSVSDVVNGVLDALVADHTVAGSVTAFIAAIKAKTDNLPTNPAATGGAMTLTSAYDAAKTTYPELADIVDGVLDELLAGHQITGSLGKAVSDAGLLGDPWAKLFLIPGSDPPEYVSAADLLFQFYIAPSLQSLTPTAAPDDLTMCRVTGRFELPDGTWANKVAIQFDLVVPDGGPAKSDNIIVQQQIVTSTDTLGYLTYKGRQWVDLERNDFVVPADTYWTITSVSLGFDATPFTLAARTFDLMTLIV